MATKLMIMMLEHCGKGVIDRESLSEILCVIVPVPQSGESSKQRKQNL